MKGVDRALYRLLLLLFPREFRTDFGLDMEQLYLDRLHREGGGWGGARFRIEGAWDVIREAVGERSAQMARAYDTWIRGGGGMGGWNQDVRYGVRSLAKRPGFTAAAVGTLALGIAATVAVFGVVQAVLLAPLPYPAADALVAFDNRSSVTGAITGESFDHPDVRAIQAQVPGITVAGYSGTSPTLTGFGDPRIVSGVRVTDGLITLTGLSPVIGRDLTATDDDPDGRRVAVVSHAIWQQELGGTTDALGRTLTLGGEPWEVIGVAPAGFDFPGDTEVWLPRRHVVEECGHGCRLMRVVGRLDGAEEEVRARLDALSVQIAESFPDSHTESRFHFSPLREQQVASVRTGILVLFGAVLMVLLIACANVANLLLVRAHARRGEVALRLTLGASRLRVARQLMTESVLIAGLAGLIGTAMAWWATAALVRIAPESLPRLESVRIDGSALAFALVLTVVATGLFGVLPALRASRDVDVSRGGRQESGGAGSDRSRSALLTLEFALSLSLLLGTGLLMRTLAEIRAVDLGFEVEQVERFRFGIPDARYDSLGATEIVTSIENEIRSLPGVRAVGWGFGVPLAGGNINATVELLDRPEVAPQDQPGLAVRPSSPGFLEASGMRLVSGRWFTDDDRHGAEPVIVVNEATVREHYPDVDPIGRQMELQVSWSFEASPPRTIVGVVADVIRSSPTEPPPAAVYLPNAQFGARSGYMTVRLEPGVASVIPEARTIVTRHDPGMAIYGEEALREAVLDARADTTFYTTLLTLFSGLALLLAAVGLYGVVSYAVSQRTREIGVRIALGADAGSVVGMVVRQGVRPVIAGAILGLVLSAFGGRLISSMLFGVSPQDPITIVGVTLLLATIACIATIVPARRAARIAPSSALKADA